MTRSLYGTLGLLAALLLSCSTFAETLPPANQPSPKVGRVVEYDAQVATVGCKRWEVTDTDKDGSIVSQCGDNISYVSAENGNVTKIVSKNGNVMLEFKPRLFSLSFPLEVGKTWQGRYSGYSAYNDAHWDADTTCEVKPPEKVEVPAGKFDAYRIDCVDNWQSMGLNGQTHISSWYAPKVGVTVKVVSTENPEWDYQVTSISEK